jgi:hypothetical protein
MRSAWIALPLVLLFACDAADGRGTESTSSSIETATATGILQGRVTAKNGSPIGDVVVTATNDGTQQSTFTDADGQYSMSLPVGKYTVTATAFGFETATATGLKVTPSRPAVQNLVLTPLPTHRVSGTVSGAGQPIAGARVAIVGTPLPPATTDATGHYGFDSVPNGNYQVTASAGCFGDATASLTVDGDETLDFTLARRIDSFGYSCTLSSFSYVAASTILPLVGDINFTTVPLPFPFRLYGKSYTTAFVATDGFLSFVDPQPIPLDNSPSLPDPATPNAAIYPFWDDLVVDAVSSVRTELVGNGRNRRFVIEWRNVTPFPDPTQRLSFEVVLFENGQILTQYQSVFANGAGAAIGLENETGTVAFVYSNNAPSVDTGTAILFTPPSGK